MKKLIFAASAALLAMTVTAQPAVISTFGTNPVSAAGFFAADPNGAGVGGLFKDQYTFNLVGGPAFVTIASATNTFADGAINGPQYIKNFAAAIFQTFDNIIGNADDVLKFGPQFATLCGNGKCQTLDGEGLLFAGNYYLQIQGDAGINAGYGGNLSVAQTPLPAAAWLFGTGLAGLGLLARRRRKQQSALA
jgi:hypothetical protein